MHYNITRISKLICRKLVLLLVILKYFIRMFRVYLLTSLILWNCWILLNMIWLPCWKLMRWQSLAICTRIFVGVIIFVWNYLHEKPILLGGRLGVVLFWFVNPLKFLAFLKNILNGESWPNWSSKNNINSMLYTEILLRNLRIVHIFLRSY